MDGVSAHTISRDTALRQALNWAWKNNIIAPAPFVADVPGNPAPKSLIYSVEQVAVLLDAGCAHEERQYAHLFAMVMLRTHGRGEAILKLDTMLGQIQDGLIYFNATERKQSKKRRSIVPILAPWLEDASGRASQWKKRRIDRAIGETIFGDARLWHQGCIRGLPACRAGQSTATGNHRNVRQPRDSRAAPLTVGMCFASPSTH